MFFSKNQFSDLQTCRVFWLLLNRFNDEISWNIKVSFKKCSLKKFVSALEFKKDVDQLILNKLHYHQFCKKNQKTETFFLQTFRVIECSNGTKERVKQPKNFMTKIYTCNAQVRQFRSKFRFKNLQYQKSSISIERKHCAKILSSEALNRLKNQNTDCALINFLHEIISNLKKV